MAKLFRVNVEVVADHEVIRNITTSTGSFVAWLGAGPSREAGIKTGGEICTQLREEMVSSVRPTDADAWAAAELNWDDQKRRYSAVLQQARPTRALRVQYFRELVRGLQPSFSHHVVSLLMSSGIIKRTCLTTNFDKLLEMAHSQQGESDWQAIRSEDEAEFWDELDDKCFIIKLHGDYDTHNLLNTSEETLQIPRRLQQIAHEVLRQSGLVILGSSGYEESVMRLLNDLISDDNDDRALNHGIYWGVNVGVEPPDHLSGDDLEGRVMEKLRAGSVSREAVEFLARASDRNRRAAFFPAWGASGFLLKLVQATGNKAIIGRSSRYLDNNVRLRRVFAAGNLDPGAIATRIAKLETHAARRLRDVLIRRSAEWEIAVSAMSQAVSTGIEVAYGDITSRSLMSSVRFPAGRRGVLSPDDNFLSAGGGVSLALAEKAGKHFMLSELAKLSPIKPCEVAVTSGGDLPVHYVLHGAATEIKVDGTSRVTVESITDTVKNSLDTAKLLALRVLLIPLLGTGTEGMAAGISLEAIIDAITRFSNENRTYPLMIPLVIYAEKSIGRNDVKRVLETKLGPSWSVKA